MKIEFKTYLDKEHRYQLVRGCDKNVICFLMLNPSNADDKKNDPTINKLEGFMSNLGHSGLIVVNLCSFITSDPKKLNKYIKKEKNIEKFNNLNDKYINFSFKISKTIVAGYGILKAPALNQRAKKILNMTDKTIYALKITKNGFPNHPLYLTRNCNLIPFKL